MVGLNVVSFRSRRRKDGTRSLKRGGRKGTSGEIDFEQEYTALGILETG